MKSALFVAALAAITMLPLANADHDAGCVPTQADPATINEVHTPDGRLFYFEERGGLVVGGIPVPESGFWLGDGSWWYEETNGIDGLQRGGVGITGACFPPEPAPCVIIDEDPITDEHCGHGSDQLIW